MRYYESISAGMISPKAGVLVSGSGQNLKKFKRASAQVVIFGEPLRKRAVMSKYQCANRNHCLIKGAVLSEWQCANGDPHLRRGFLKIPTGPLRHKKRTRKGRQCDNDRQKLVSSNFGLTMRKKILTMRGMTPTMRARYASMRAKYFIAKIAHMVTANARVNLVRI